MIRAAVAGNAIAQHNLACCYEQGLVGHPVNLQDTVQLHSLAAQSALPCSKYCLGIAYKIGLSGLTPDLNKAKDMYAHLVGERSPSADYTNKAQLRLDGIITGLRQISVIKKLPDDRTLEWLFQLENEKKLELLAIAVKVDDIEFIRKAYTTNSDHVKGMYSEQLKNQCSQYIDSLTTVKVY